MRYPATLRPQRLLTAALVCALAMPLAALAADDNLTLTYTTTTANGGYKPKNVLVVYLTDSQNGFVATVGSGTGTPRALWANSRAHDLTQWWNGNPGAQADIDARTGATQTAYKTYTFSWNWKKRDGSVVPDGTYKLKFELTDDNANKNKYNRTEFTVTKGRTAWKVGPVTQGGYQNVVLDYKPSEPLTVACEPNALDFGARAEGTATDQSFAIVNYNTVAVTITGMQITGIDKAAYSLLSPPSVPFFVPVAGRQVPGTAAITVRFTPDAAKTFNTAQVELVGTDISPIPPVSLRGQGVMPWARISVSTERLSLPQVMPGLLSNAFFSIGNVGQGAMNVRSLRFVGQDADAYKLVAPIDSPFEILPGQPPVQVAVEFSPKTYKSYNHAALAIACNDPNRPVIQVALEGYGGPLVAGRLQVLSGIGGQCQAIALHGTRAVIGQGQVLSIYEVADRDGPSLVANTVLPGVIEDVTLLGDTAYVTMGDSGFALVHVDEVSAPALLAVVDTEGFCHATAPVGNKLFVADGQTGLLAYDVSSPTSPGLIWTLPGDIASVTASADKALCLDSQAGLLLIDATTLRLIGQDERLRLGQALAVDGPTAYVADRLGALFVVDVHTAERPTVLGQVQLNSAIQSLVVTGAMICGATGQSGLEMIDVSNSTQPTRCSPLALGGDTIDLAANDIGVYVVNRELGLFDFRLPSDCTLVQRRAASLGMTPMDVAVDGDLAFVAGGEAGLWIYGIADPNSPKVRGAWFDRVQAVTLSSKAAYLACGPSGLKILDVSQPAAPVEVGAMDVNGLADTVACDGRTVMVGTGNSVKIFDATDPHRPPLVATWSSRGQVLGLKTAQGLGFVACGGQGLVILNGDGTVAGTLDTPGVACDVCVSKGIAYVADGPGGVHLIDVSGAAPSLIATLPVPGPAQALAIDGNDLYVAGQFGAWQIDVTIAAYPKIKATAPLPSRVGAMAASESAILTACPRAGVILLRKP